ncbi:enamine deaminase RidA (YjgF/YER057c/UK114 family) [Chitinophaga sp. W3I9]|uniref:RidA family protein n=1 Tax=Chitinophaga sp. W3I9 TaxID=3373924 RepID=UPI003D26342C
MRRFPRRNILIAAAALALTGTLFIIFKSIDMEKETKMPAFINPPGLYDPAPNAYSHIAVVPAGNTLVFIAGQGGETADGSLVNDFRTQLKQTFSNLDAALKSQGLKFSDVVKLTTLVVDHNEEKLKILTEESLRIWPDKKFPVNTLIPVPRLALDGMLVEIDATAVKR